MSDTTESIIIAVQSQGLDKVMSDLQAAGQTGTQVANTIAQAFASTSRSSDDLKNRTIILADAIARGVTNFEQYARNLQEVNSANLAAAASAIKLEQAELAAAEATAKASEAAATGATSLKAHNDAVVATSGSYGGLKSILTTVGGLFAISEIKSSADEYIKLSNQIKQVTHSQQEFDDVLGRLKDTANSAQTDIGAVTKLYYNLAQSTRDLKPTQDQLLTAVDAITQGLYANGVQGTEAKRVIKDFSEVLSGAGNASRLFNSIQQQAPGLLKDLADQMTGGNVEALRKMGSGTTTATKATKDYTSTLASQKSSIDNQAAALTNLDKKIASGTLSGNALTQAITKQRDEADKLAAAHNNYAKTRDLATQADTKAVKTLQDANVTAKQFLDALDKLDLKEKALAGEQQGSLSGALIVLHNNFVLLVGDTDKATGGLSLVRDAIIAIAKNLDTIIPLVATFAAAWALGKVINTVNDLKNAFVSLSVAEGIADGLSFGGWVVIIAGVVIAIGYLLDKLGLLEPIQKVLDAFWDRFTQGAQNAWNNIKDFFAWIKTNDFTVWLTDHLTNIWDNWNKGIDAIEQAWQNFVSTIENSDIARFLQSVVDTFNGITSAERDAANQAIQTRNAINSIPQNLDFSNAPLSSGSQHGFATGGQFRVPGAGPVDSQYVHFMATPGEMVTIHTPQQAANNNVPHFRNGGSIGIDQGLRGVNVSFGTSATNSVTGYAPVALPIPPAQASAISNGSMPVSSASAAITAATAPTTITINGTQFTPNGIPVSELQQASANAQTKYDNDRFEFEYDKNDLNPFVFWPSPGPGLPSGMNGALMQLQMDAAAGAVPWSPDRLAYEKSTHNNFMRALQPGSVTGGAGGLGQDVFAPYAAQDAATNAKLHPGPSVTSYGAITVGAITYVPAPGQSYHLRDGGDMYVDGAGAVDSRYVGLNVSPGESVHVRTPAQRAAANSNGGTNITQNFNITTKDMSDVRASSKQLGQDAAAKAARAMRRSGLG